ncbi:hypothetical protein [Bizionia sp.]|uniref:hypothetical protein n=1 Tax=Bizionia sp. TaxID=1954480 RepID=UPI003A8FAB97
MQKKASAFICAFLLCFSITGQEKKISIKGLIKNTYLLPVKDAHIINLNTSKGTISNKDGEFEIPVRLGDWLEITNLQYKVKKIKISQTNIKEGIILIYLLERNNELNEVELKKKLTGFLKHDMIKKKADTTPKLDKGYYDFSKMDFSKIPLDHSKKPPSSQLLTDPVAKVAGVPIASVGIPDKSSIKKRAQRKALDFKRSLANKLLERLGEQFFFTSLKIPKESFPHFINYCSYLGIESLFKKDKVLELIAIFKKESINYLKMIEKSK